MAKDSRPVHSHRIHPYVYHRPYPPPKSPSQQATSDEERLLASADLMAGRVDELLKELAQANKLGLILTYDKNTNSWEPWFRYQHTFLCHIINH
jgi:hypothetical protein